MLIWKRYWDSKRKRYRTYWGVSSKKGLQRWFSWE